MVTDLRAEFKDEQNKINRLEMASEKQNDKVNIDIKEKEKEIAQLHKILADNASRFIVQDDTVERILSMVTDLRAEFKDEQNKINRLDIASEKQNNKVNAHIKQVMRVLEMVIDLLDQRAKHLMHLQFSRENTA